MPIPEWATLLEPGVWIPVGVLMGAITAVVELSKFALARLSKDNNGRAILQRLERIEKKLDDRLQGEIQLRERVTRLESRQ